MKPSLKKFVVFADFDPTTDETKKRSSVWSVMRDGVLERINWVVDGSRLEIPSCPLLGSVEPAE